MSKTLFYPNHLIAAPGLLSYPNQCNFTKLRNVWCRFTAYFVWFVKLFWVDLKSPWNINVWLDQKKYEQNYSQKFKLYHSYRDQHHLTISVCSSDFILMIGMCIYTTKLFVHDNSCAFQDSEFFKINSISEKHIL